jgi:hypothetical protein
MIMGKYRVIMEAVIPSLKANRLSLLNRMVPRKYFEFSTGEALFHTSKKASKWTLGPWPDFGPKMLKPPYTPDPAPLDCVIPSEFKALTCNSSHSQITNIKISVTKGRRGLDQGYLIIVN